MVEKTHKLQIEAGFSLVEVTIAMGVIAFAFISVFGLIPTGLNAFHQAIDTSIGSQIAQKVINDAEQTDFSTLTDSTNLPVTLPANYSFQGPAVNGPAIRYFDEQGDELLSSQVSRAVYQVRTRITPATVTPYFATGQSSTATDVDLATVTIQIASNPGNQSIPIDPTTNLWSSPLIPLTTYSTMVSKNQ